MTAAPLCLPISVLDCLRHLRRCLAPPLVLLSRNSLLLFRRKHTCPSLDVGTADVPTFPLTTLLSRLTTRFSMAQATLVLAVRSSSFRVDRTKVGALLLVVGPGPEPLAPSLVRLRSRSKERLGLLTLGMTVTLRLVVQVISLTNLSRA